ncbi:MAG TPA: hypothetical protein VGB45_10215 [Abditibacterium sp.]|jgi:hypothetical protein
MSHNLNLFDQQNDEIWTPSAPAPKTEPKMPVPIVNHPYARYGLAVALWKAKINGNPTETELREALAAALETGLENFRVRTEDDPEGPVRQLEFRAIPLVQLQAEPNLVYVKGINDTGRYLRPTIITCVLGQSQAQIIPRTFAKALELVVKLRNPKNSLHGSNEELSRSFVPVSGEVNNGRPNSKTPTGTLFEAACCAVTTLTPTKPAAFARKLDGKVTERINVTIIPDLGEIERTRDFIQLFDQMANSQLAADLMTAHLGPLKPPPDLNATKRMGVKKAVVAAPKSAFRRPKLHSGNYPFAPRDAAAFGAVGLLAAIGRWALEAQYVDKEWARGVLGSLAEAPLYLVSYDKVSQVRFGAHIVSLSMEGQLSRILQALWGSTRLYADLENARIDPSSPAYQLFYLQTSRFLQTFSRPAFADFLSNRAEYPALCRSLLDGYFHHMKIDSAIVSSARALGQHLNRTAYFVAKEEYATENGPGDEDKIRKAKAKILVEFESAVLSAKTSRLMLSTISTRAGRLLNGDLPSSAQIYMDATNEGVLELEDAKHLLIAYLRLRSPQQERVQKEVVAEDADVSETTAEVPFTDDKE